METVELRKYYVKYGALWYMGGGSFSFDMNDGASMDSYGDAYRTLTSIIGALSSDVPTTICCHTITHKWDYACEE